MTQLNRSALQVEFASGTFATEEKFVTLACSFFNFEDDTFHLLETPDNVEITRVVLPEASVMAQSASASFWQFFTSDKANRQEFYVWYNSGTAIDPSGSGTGIEVGTNVDDLAASVATNTASAISAAAGSFVTAVASGTTIDLTTLHTGSVANAADGNQPMGSGFAIGITQAGSDGGASAWNISASGHFIPETGSVQDIGSSALPIRSLYMSGSSLFIDNNQTLFASAGVIHLSVSAAPIRISALDVNVIADQDVSLTASALLALKGSTITLNSSTDITITASQLLDLKGSTVSISAIGPIALTASTTDGTISLNSQNTLNLISVSGFVTMRAQSIFGDVEIGAGDDITVSATDNVDIRAGGDLSLTASGLMALDTSNFTLVASTNITIHASQLIDINASTITIQLADSGGIIQFFTDTMRFDGIGGGGAGVVLIAPSLNINSSTSITVAASNILALTGSIVTINGTKAQVIGTDYSASVAPGAVGHERQVTVPDGTDFVTGAAPAQHWQLFTSGIDFYVWYAAGVSTDPAASGTGIEVTASTTDSAAVVASNTASAIGAVAAFAASVSGADSSIVIVTNVSTTLPGSAATDVDASVAFSGVITGSAGDVFGTGFEFAATAGGKTFLQVYNNGVKQMEGATKNWVRTDASTITFTASGVPEVNDDIEFYGFGI